MSNRIARRFPFKLVHVNAIPADYFGVYSFWFKGRCLYIGQAKSQPIKKRLNQHFDVSHNDRLNDWIKAYGPELTVCIMVSGRSRIDRLERRLIKSRKPVTNIQFNPNAKKKI